MHKTSPLTKLLILRFVLNADLISINAIIKLLLAFTKFDQNAKQTHPLPLDCTNIMFSTIHYLRYILYMTFRELTLRPSSGDCLLFNISALH